MLFVFSENTYYYPSNFKLFHQDSDFRFITKERGNIRIAIKQVPKK